MAENLQHYCFCLTRDQMPASDQALLSQRKAALLKNSKWQTGDQITIRFLEGDPGLQKRVQPLPGACVARLPRLPRDWSRVVLSGRIILLDPGQRIVDLFWFGRD